jgi:hypothetical protein
MRLLWQGARLDTYLTIVLANEEITPITEPIILWKMTLIGEPVNYEGTVSRFSPEQLQSPEALVDMVLQNIDTVYLALEQQRKDQMVLNGYILS